MESLRVLGIAAVSTKKQAGLGKHSDERKSLPWQQRRIAEWAAGIGAELVDVLVFAETRSKGKWRQELEKVKAEARRLKCDVVATTYLDRLARKMAWQGLFVEDLDKTGVRYIAIEEDLDTGRETDRVKLLALGLASEVFVITHRSKVRAAQRLRAEQGLPYPHPPYGLRRGADGGWEADPDRAPWVPRVFVWRAEGLGIPAITRRLIEGEAPPPEGGTVWYERAVREMLPRPAYKGVLDWGGFVRGPKRGRGQRIITEGAIPPLVDPNLWEQVQRTNQARSYARSRAESPWLLAGLVRALCGCGMVGGAAGGKRVDGARRGYYRTQCHKWRGHDLTLINAVWLERQVIEWLGTFRRGGQLPPAAVAAGPNVSAALGEIDGQISRNRRRLSALEDARLDGDITGERYRAKQGELDAEHARLLAAREEALARESGPGPAEIARLATALFAEYDQVSRLDPRQHPGRWKAFLQRFVLKIEVGPPAKSRKPDDRDVRMVLRLG